MNQISWGICPPSKHDPDEIRNGMFLPLMKKRSHGRFFRGGQKKISYPLGTILPLMKIFLPPLKMESVPDGKNPGHPDERFKMYLNTRALLG